jgi:hypothetical protein
MYTLTDSRATHLMNGWRLGHADRDPGGLGSVENKQKPRKRKQEKGKKRGDWTGGEGVSRLAGGRSVGQNDRSHRSPAPLHFPSPLHPTPPPPPFRKAPLNLGTHFFASRTSA